MPDAARTPMRFDEFLAWAAEQPERYELVDGTPVAMAPERAGHARAKLRAQRAIADAIRHRQLPCEAFVDGMTVRIDDRVAYEPDVVVHCGPRLPDDALVVDNPVIVVEVLSPSTRGRDAGAKLADYFRVPSIAHYLLITSNPCTVIHHARREGNEIATRIIVEGDVELDPPGIVVNIAAIAAPSDAGS